MEDARFLNNLSHEPAVVGQGMQWVRGHLQPSVSGLESERFLHPVLLELVAIAFFAPEPSFVDAFPAAEIGASFIELVVARELFSRERAVEILAQDAVPSPRKG